jgi:hypothetical protein
VSHLDMKIRSQLAKFRELIGHSLWPADMIGENRSKHSKIDRGPYPFENSALEGVHESFSADHLHFRRTHDGKRGAVSGG